MTNGYKLNDAEINVINHIDLDTIRDYEENYTLEIDMLLSKNPRLV